MSNENLPGLDFDALLAGTDDTAFEDFAAALGKLMVRGLSKLPLSAQMTISETVEAGGKVAAIVNVDPVEVVAVLSHGGQTAELFRINEQFH